MSDESFVVFVIVDESEEFFDVFLYVGLFCKSIGWRFVMLCVVEFEVFVFWVLIIDEMCC